MTMNSRKAKYQYIFNQLLEGKSVEVVVLNAAHLKRIRASLVLLKQQYDKTAEVLDLKADISKLSIEIVRKKQEDPFTYVISLAEKQETTFTIVAVGTAQVGQHEQAR